MKDLKINPRTIDSEVMLTTDKNDSYLDIVRKGCDGIGGLASHWLSCAVIRLLMMDNTLLSISCTWLFTSFSTASNRFTPLMLRYVCCCVSNIPVKYEMFHHIIIQHQPSHWPSVQHVWLQSKRLRVRFLALPQF